MVDITDIRQVGKGCNKRISEFAQALARSSFTQKGLSLSLAATIALTTIGFVQPADAQGRKIRLVRDAETEELIRDYAKPTFKAAGL